jgi:hypothetical protein
MAVTILDRVSEELLSDETSLTDSQLANLMISSFNHMFPSDSFFPGQEPMPGTTAYRFCGKDLLTDNNRRASHAFFCQKTMMQQIIDSVDSDHTRSITCSWVGRPGTHNAGKVCGADIATSPASYLISHPKGNTKCRFGACGHAVEAVFFKGTKELTRHILTEHNILCMYAVGHRKAEAFIWWCSSCWTWINGLDEDLNQHAHEHIPLINDTIHGEGYTGMTVYDINIRPIFCPFRLHNVQS